MARMTLLSLLVLSVMSTASAADQCDHPPPLQCFVQQNIQQACGDWGCVPDDSSNAQQGARGHCAPCDGNDEEAGAIQCGGRACLPNGTCDTGVTITQPEPIRPSFHLLVVDVTVPVIDADGSRYKPLVGSGYLYQLGLTTTHPQKLCDGGWTTDVPPVYLDLGASLAFAGDAQNLFANAGASWHLGGRKLGISHVSLGLLYQRVGASIWDVTDSTENGDRMGPYGSVGFLYNLFLRFSYVWALSHDNPYDHGALLVSAVYLRDLIDDFVPDRFKKHIPAKYRGD